MVKIRPVLFIVPLILLALALASGSSLILQLFALSVLLLLIAYLWTVVGIRGIEAEVGKTPEHCQVGEQFNEEIAIFNTTRIPKLWLRAEEDTSLPGYHNVSALNLPPGGFQTWESDVYCRRRGRYILGSITVTATDPLGLFSRQRQLGEPRDVFIYPATVELPYFETPSLADFGYSSGQQSISQISPNASSVREYAAGDSLSHIHWHSTAHTGKLMAKVFDADRTHDTSKSVWIVVDMNHEPQSGEGEETTEEYAITIAASLLKKYMYNGMRVGLTASGDQSYLFPPDTGEEHLWHILEALALVRATGEVPLGRLLSEGIETFKGNSTIIIITPSGTTGLVAASRQLKNRGNTVVTIFLDSPSFGGVASPIDAARALRASGVRVYVVRKGDELAKALGGRLSFTHPEYIWRYGSFG